MKKVLLTLPLIILSICIHAQEQMKHTKKSYINEKGEYHVQVDLPIYLFISTNPDLKDGHKLTSAKTPQFANPMYLDGHGTHFVKHTDNVKPIPEHDVTFEVHADGIAPVSKLNFLNTNRYQTGSQTFYGPGLNVEMTFSDEMSGIQEKYISIDKNNFKQYTQPENITTEGKHNIQAYAVDNVGNVEETKAIDFTLDISAPKTTITYKGSKVMVNGEQIISPKGKFSLKSKDNLSGISKTYYSYDGIEKKIRYNGDPLYIKSFNEGSHSIEYHSVDNVKNEEGKKTEKFFLDKTAPEVNFTIKSDKHVTKQTTFVSDRTRLVLTAQDNKAGLEEIYYASEGNEYIKYTSEIKITKNTSVYAYALDKVGNKGKALSSQTFYHLDNTAPNISHRYDGPKFFTRDTMFIRKITKVKLSGTDQESRLKQIDYTIDNTSSKAYSSPFTVDKNGFHKINYSGTDNVNNKTLDDFFFVVDNEGPKVHIHFGSEPLGFKKIRDKEIKIYSRHSKLYLAGTDNAVGTDKIYYSINGGPEFVYTNPLKNFTTGKNYTIEVRAIDFLGNDDTSIIEFSVEE
ncbi:hypothetical protein ABW636_16015 [Aquimarina sp. 2201CG1-2-11]|uniref:OmpL47-type beta-barrel domain-containing protein n=1 Tax=Aquimarina discodermiae TaxID=3231043 RepID=UPI003463380B